MDVDPKYEYNAPQFVDFARMDEEEHGVDVYFDRFHAHEHGMELSMESEELSANNSVEEPKTDRILRSTRALVQTDVVKPSPANQHPAELANVCSSLSKWRSKEACPVKNQSQETSSRKWAKLKDARKVSNSNQNKVSTEAMPAKRRRLNEPGLLCQQKIAPNKNLPTGKSQHPIVKPNRLTRSLTDKAPKVQISRSLENTVVKSPCRLTASLRDVSRPLRSKSTTMSTSLGGSQTLRGSLSICNKTDISKKPRLTLPETPVLMKRRTKTSVATNVKTTEELELEKMAKFQKDLAKKIETNAESYRIALAGRVPEQIHALKQVTRPEEFHFQTDSRIKDQVPRDNISSEVDFAAILRKNDAPSKTVHRSTTEPKPFHFHDGKKRRREPEEQNQPGYKFETMGEKLLKYSTKTPERFRMKTKPALNPIIESPHLTIAQTPNLVTKMRTRKTHVLSQAELEELEIVDMKKNQFKAQPLNENVLTRHGIGVKVVPRKPPTVPEPFCLSSDCHHDSSSLTDNEVEITFRANPVPKAILERVVGVKPAVKLPLTAAQSPAFNLRKSSRIASKNNEENDVKPVLSHPVPNFSEPFKPQLSHTVTQVKPFSFETRTHEMFQHKKEKIQKVLLEEEEARKFFANPMPDLTVVDVPEKHKVAATLPVPFDLNVDLRGEVKSRRWRDQLEEEQRTQREMATFKARPPTVLQQLPFEPQRGLRPTIDPEPFNMSTEFRAEKRAEFERWRLEQEQVAELERLHREQERLANDEREVQRRRAEAVHRANPIRHYKPVAPRDAMPLTTPLSPKFSNRLRSKTGAN